MRDWYAFPRGPVRMRQDWLSCAGEVALKASRRFDFIPAGSPRPKEHPTVLSILCMRGEDRSTTFILSPNLAKKWRCRRPPRSICQPLHRPINQIKYPFAHVPYCFFLPCTTLAHHSARHPPTKVDRRDRHSARGHAETTCAITSTIRS
jgi:hypothetical protein